MARWPLILVLAGLALHFPGWLWHDMFHAHEGLETLRTQAVFYLATAVVFAGAFMGASRSLAPRLRWSYAAVLIGALLETAGWVWDFAAHYAGENSEAAHTTVYVGAAIAVLGALAAIVARPRSRA
jgi:hypothetical protein